MIQKIILLGFKASASSKDEKYARKKCTLYWKGIIAE